MKPGPAKVIALLKERARLIRALRAAAKALRVFGHIPEARKAEALLNELK